MHALIENGEVKQYPYGADVLRRDNPQTSFPRNPSDDLLATFNVFPVKPTERPAYDPMTQRVEEGTPVRQQVRNPDGTFRSDDPATTENEAWEWVQKWQVTPLSAEEIAQQQLTLQDAIVAATQQRLDDFARTRNYDGILSACTYATSAVPKFAAEGQYAVQARDATWAALYQFMADVQAGTQPVPTGFEDVGPLLPPLAWPI